MKAWIALLLGLMLVLAACAPAAVGSTDTPTPTPTPTPTDMPVITATPVTTQTPLLSSAEYPRMDGSTACMPLMALTRARVTGEELTIAEAYTDCRTTPLAYQALLHGEADILLVYEPAQVTRTMIDQSGVALDFTPIGRDALVFIVNEQNPVKSLTIAQLQDIYSGKITNWKEVGGADQQIAAYQRAEASGSQALFMKLLMGDRVPMQVDVAFYPGEMNELIEIIASYNNQGNALGFSVYYYAAHMYAKPGLKFLQVEGIEPSEQTLREQSYPLTHDFYVVTRADDPPDSNAIRLRDWITGPLGKQTVIDAGYVGI